MQTTEEKIGYLKSRVEDADESMLLDLLVSCNGDVKQTLGLLGVKPAESSELEPGHQSTLKRFMKPEEYSKVKRAKTDLKGQTVHLYDPEEVAEVIPCCTLHFNVFGRDLSNNLLKSLLEDSKDWSKSNFYMFGRAVQSHHTAHMYTDNQELLTNQDATYNGKSNIDIRPFDKYMKDARDLVQHKTNEQIKKRGLTRYQYPGEWHSDVAICNRYEGPNESVGYHSDQLTHIGPHCVISSISLGTTRQFRLKPRHDKGKSTIAVHLPHNSLFIMHAGCQEEYKHSIVPLRNISIHPIAGKTRINLTYRMYLDEFKTENVPKCGCGMTMILRTTIKKKDDDEYRYIWQCPSGYHGDEKGCGKLFYPDFKKNF